MRTDGKTAHNKKPNGKKSSKVIAETQTAAQGIEEEKKEGPRTLVMIEKQREMERWTEEYREVLKNRF